MILTKDDKRLAGNCKGKDVSDSKNKEPFRMSASFDDCAMTELRIK